MNRLAEAIKLAGGQTKVSSEMGVNPKTVSRWERGEAAAKFEDVVTLAKMAKVSLSWIAGEDTDSPNSNDSNIAIPRYDAPLSAGNGSFTERASILNHIPFRKDFFTKNMGRNAENMIIVDARGDSMAPTMQDRDILMIDTSTAERPLTSGIYGFTFDDQLFVKRLDVTPNRIKAVSDNKVYDPFEITEDDGDKFHPIGRVVWIGRIL